MEIKDYIRLFRKRLWLIALMTLLFAGLSYQINSRGTVTYKAHTTIAVGTFIQSPNPDDREIQTSSELAVTYGELAKSYKVLQGTVDALNLAMSTSDLKAAMKTRILEGTSLLVLEITYTDPELAAQIANELGRQLILQSPTYLTPEQQAQIELAENQIAELTVPLEALRQEYDQLDDELLAAQYPDEINRIKARRDIVVEQIGQLSSTIAEYSGNITYLQQRRNSLDIVDVAQIPISPDSRPVLGFTIVGAVFGAVLAVVVVLATEYLRNTFETSGEAARMLGVPVLGVIARFRRSGADRSKCLITNHSRNHFALEAYQTLQTNLQLTANGSSKNVYLITSPGAGEGKTITVANLAIAMTRADLRVVVVDADLRRPQIHETFGIGNAAGLSTFLLEETSDSGSPDMEDKEACAKRLGQVLQNTEIPRLSVITSGSEREHLSEMLGTTHLSNFFETLRSSANIDVILVDSPPCLPVADSLRLAEAADAKVILVLAAKQTRRDSAVKAQERFAFVGRNILGVVVNKANTRGEEYYGSKASKYYSKLPEKRPREKHGS